MKLATYIDGYHASSLAPINIPGAGDNGIAAPTIAQLMLGVRAYNDGTSPQYMTGDIAEMMIYDQALTNAELDRLGHYLSIKYALPYMRLDQHPGSASRSVPRWRSSPVRSAGSTPGTPVPAARNCSGTAGSASP